MITTVLVFHCVTLIIMIMMIIIILIIIAAQYCQIPGGLNIKLIFSMVRIQQKYSFMIRA